MTTVRATFELTSKTGNSITSIPATKKALKGTNLTLGDEWGDLFLIITEDKACKMMNQGEITLPSGATLQITGWE